MTTAVRLRDVGSTYGGLTGKTRADFGTGDASFVTFLEVINNTRLHGTSLERVRVARGERQNRVMRQDLLFNGSSETPEEVALSAIVDFEPTTDTFLNSFCFGFRLRQTETVNPAYLAYFFRSPSGRSLVASLAQGATRYNIAKTKFLDVEIALPSPERQRQIVEFLEDADDLISTLERLIAKKQAIKQGMIQQLLTGRTRLPGFDDDWTETKLSQVLSFEVGFPFRSEFFIDTPQGMRLVRNRDLKEQNSRTYYYGPFADSYVVTDGDVLIGMDGDFSPCLWRGGRALLNQRVGRLRVNGCSSRYMYYALAAPLSALEAGTGATTVKHLSHADVEKLRLVLPSIEEQDAIARTLGDIDAEILILHARLAKARAIKTGMMQQLLTGRVRLPVEVSA